MGPVNEKENFLSWIKDVSVDMLILVNSAKLTLFEIAKCKEISDCKKISLDGVIKKMAEFKKTKNHILYKEDFSC